MALSEKERLIRRRLRDELDYYARKNLKILPKEGGSVIPFAMNEAQRYTHARVEEQLKEKGRVRAMNLKGRQQGISTYWEGRYYWKVTHRKGVRAFILTHEQEATDNIFDMVSRFHDYSRSDLKPHTGAASAKELYFDLLDSGYSVGTAGNQATGRSKTTQYFHGSEVAHWKNADQHKAGVMQTVPDLPDTEIALESTAFGIGGMFHDMWKDAEKGLNEYLAIFIPWFWQREYRKPVPPGFKRTKEEEALAKIYRLDDQQLAWRRAKIAELKPSEGGNPEDLFRQEYPCLVGSSRIATARGILPMCEVAPGDRGDNGEITRQWSTGVKPVFGVETSLGYSLTATANHPMAREDDGFAAVSEALGVRVRLQPPRFADHEYAATWRPAPCVESRFSVTPDMGRFLGYFMGDGSYSAGTLSIACDGQDDDVIADVSLLMQAVTGRANTRAVGTKQGGIEVRTGFRYGRELLGALGLIEGGDYLRRKVCVPECIWRSPEAVVREFLRGLFEADGFAGDVPRVILFSRYREFLRDVQLLLLGFGITARLRTANKIAGDGHTYIGNELALRASEARLFAARIGFVSRRKHGRTARWRLPNGIGRPAAPVQLVDMVTSVVPCGEAEVFDLTVADSHVFGANGLLVHNCNPEEAFLFSGRLVFSAGKLQEALLECWTPKWRGEMTGSGFTENEMGRLKIWQKPRAGERYVIGADVAEGLEHGDFSVADVLLVPSGQMVAQFHGHIDPDLYGVLLFHLGNYYNTALLGVERNNHGLTTVTRLKHQKYKRLFIQEDLEHVAEEKKMKKAGWLTTEKSKYKIIDQLAAELRDGSHGIACEETIKEMSTFIYDDNNHMGAKPGCFDDRVMARAIAGEMLRHAPRQHQHQAPASPTTSVGAYR